MSIKCKKNVIKYRRKRLWIGKTCFFLSYILPFFTMKKSFMKSVVKELVKQIGSEKVFSEQEYLICYSYDATGQKYLPDLVVFPRNEEDIQKILRVAFKYKIPVTPRGAGVGYSGGAVPLKGGIVIVFTRMNRILKIDKENLQAEVEPGVVTFDLQQECEKSGLFYPPDPASLKTSTIGGNIAENAGGPRCFKYGVSKNYVLGLEAFLINGEKINTGSRAIKDVAGYDLTSLLTGSEGTLAIISRIILKLIPKPEYNIMLRIDFSSLKTGAGFINKVIRAGVDPSVLEFMDQSSIEAAYSYLRIKKKDTLNAIVLVELDGNKSDVLIRKERLLALIAENEVLDYTIAMTAEDQEKLWQVRRNISPAISSFKSLKINEDIAVPMGKIPQTVDFINTLARDNNLKIVLFGHFGDGNIHTNLLVDPQDTDEMERAKTALDEIFKYVIASGGSITGEHGVGITKKPFMKYQFSDLEIDLFRKLKNVFDPQNLLNPGKIF